MVKKLHPKQIRKLAGDTMLTENTIRRWMNGGAVTPANDQLLQKVASELGYLTENEVPHDEK